MSKPRIVICTDFFGKYDVYSVSNVAFTEAQSFVDLGYDVTMMVRTTYPKDDEVPGIKFLKVMPHPTNIDGIDPNFVTPKDWKERAQEARDVLQKHLQDFDIAITHDWILQNSCVSWNWAMRRVMLPKLTWFHRLHSYPTGDPVGDLERDEFTELKCTLPENGEHFLVWANNGHALWLSERYLSDLSKVKVIPLGIDWVDYFAMHKHSRYIIKQMDALNSTVVQCYAFCSSRMVHKGVRYLLEIMASFKQMGERVKLILCNANSTLENKERDEITQLANEAKSWGLNEFEDFCFTSRLKKEFLHGVDRAVVRDLQIISNSFIFPSETETYGLVALEAAATGAFLVLNDELVPLKEVGGLHSMFMPWDSDHKNTKTKRHWNPSEREAMHQYARAIHPELATNRILRNKMRVLTEHYSVNVARRYWEPLFYKYWSVPVDQRGAAPEVTGVQEQESIEEGVKVGTKDEVEALDKSLAPRLGVAGVVSAPEESPEEQPEKKPEQVILKVEQEGEIGLLAARVDVMKPELVEKAEWPGEEKPVSVDIQDLPEVCLKEGCEGEMVLLATGDKLGCKKCGGQIDRPVKE